MSRRTIRLQRSPNASTAALIGHPDRGSCVSPIRRTYGRIRLAHKCLQSTSASVLSARPVANHKRKGPMLKQVAEGVLTHQSAFMQTNAVVVQGDDGVLLIDAGITNDEMVCLASDLSDLGQTVAAGFSTHPHWDHLLWHDSLGEAPRYGTARCAATVRERLPDAEAKARAAGSGLIPPDIAEQMTLDRLGAITGLPEDAARIPWDGPEV